MKSNRIKYFKRNNKSLNRGNNLIIIQLNNKILYNSS